MSVADEEWKRVRLSSFASRFHTPLKAFADCQIRMQDLVRQLNNCRGQIHSRDREGRMAELTGREIKAFVAKQANTVTYKGIGRMYVDLISL